MKLVLVTGGNRGIGLEICRQLDTLGYNVIMGSRDIEKGVSAAGSISEKVIVKQLDVTNEESIQQLFEYVNNEYGNLDVLINNAGIGEKNKGYENSFIANTKNFIETRLPGTWKLAKGAKSFLGKAGVEVRQRSAINTSLMSVKQIMDTNFYSAWRMVQVFHPLLLKAEEGKIINVSSGMGELKSLTGYFPGYSLSKTSLNALTIMLANELKDDGIKVNALCPGWVKTDMGGLDAPRNVSQGADTAVWLATESNIPTGRFFRDRKEINW
jgi:NAD(P)-dependent dehydrogenase (short-subunit alcohol dehydrogenase family)